MSQAQEKTKLNIYHLFKNLKKSDKNPVDQNDVAIDVNPVDKKKRRGSLQNISDVLSQVIPTVKNRRASLRGSISSMSPVLNSENETPEPPAQIKTRKGAGSNSLPDSPVSYDSVRIHSVRNDVKKAKSSTSSPNPNFSMVISPDLSGKSHLHTRYSVVSQDGSSCEDKSLLSDITVGSFEKAEKLGIFQGFPLKNSGNSSFDDEKSGKEGSYLRKSSLTSSLEESWREPTRSGSYDQNTFDFDKLNVGRLIRKNSNDINSPEQSENLEEKRKQKVSELLKKRSSKSWKRGAKSTLEVVSNENGSVRVSIDGKEMMIVEALYLMAYNGEVENLTTLVKNEEIRKSIDRFYKEITPLHAAASTNQTECIDILIFHGAQIDVKDVTERTPLHVAVSLKQQEAVVSLLAKGSVVNVRDRYGNHPFQLAVKLHYFDIANDLILFGADVNFKKNDGSSIMHEVLNNGDSEALEFMGSLSSKVNVNIKDSAGETPLFKCIAKNKVDVLKSFLRLFKPKINMYNDMGQNIYHVGLRSNSMEALQFISEYDEKIRSELINSAQDKKKTRPIHFAINIGSPQLLQSFLDLKPDVNSKDSDGNTPLHLAAKHDHMYRMLLMAGAKPDLKNNNGDIARKKNL